MIVSYYQLDLIEDVALSASTASAGGHRSLNYIPGSTLLGALASHYDAFSDPWTVFHSGRVRVSNAYPLLEGRRAHPVPSLWTEAMEGSAAPLKSARGQFFVGSNLLRPRLAKRQKAALDRARRGAPKNGQFHEIEAIARDQRFAFSVAVDVPGSSADLVEALASKISRFLEGTFAIGRSRSAEFGLVNCTRLAQTAEATASSGGPREGATDLSLYAVSDIVVSGALADLAAEFDLPAGWELISSTPRTRRVSGFNGHRRSHTTDRHVIDKGTLLRFRGPALERDTAACLAVALSGGVGGGRAEGFGEVISDPVFPDHAPFGHRDAQQVEAAADPPSDALYAWACARVAEASESTEIEAETRRFLAYFRALYEEALDQAAVEQKRLGDLTPGRAQWGAVRNRAEKDTEAATLADALRLDASLFGKPQSTRQRWASEGLDPRTEEDRAAGDGMTQLPDRQASDASGAEETISFAALLAAFHAKLSAGPGGATRAASGVARLAAEMPRLLATMEEE